MNVPTWAGFVADFPDDEVVNGDDIQVFGGHNVALTLGEIFAGLGCSQISNPESAGDQGWSFDFHYNGRNRFWCRVQSFHPVFWLLFEDLSASNKGAAAYVELWRQFGIALELDPRFRKILWRPFKEGPPDWDEVEAARDPPERSFEEEFPPTEVRPKRPRPPIISVAFSVLFTIMGLIELIEIPGEQYKVDIEVHLIVGIPLFILGSWIFFRSLVRWRG